MVHGDDGLVLPPAIAPYNRYYSNWGLKKSYRRNKKGENELKI